MFDDREDRVTFRHPFKGLVVDRYVVLREIGTGFAGGSFSFLLLFELNAILLCLGQRDDLLNVQQEPLAIAIRFQPNTMDAEISFVEPHHGRGQLLGEFCGCQDDPNVLGELVLVRFFPLQEFEDCCTGIFVPTVLAQVSTKDLNYVVEGHGRDHRRVTDRLQLHMPAVFGPLQLDHNEVGILVQPQQIDPPPAVFPLAELFGDDQRVGRDDVDLLAQ